MALASTIRRAALLGLIAFVGAACGGSTTPESFLERDLTGTWQSLGCSTNGSEPELEATCLTLELDPSRQYTFTADSDVLEDAADGRWGVVSVDETRGQLHLEPDVVAPVVLRGDELEFFGQTMVKVTSSSASARSSPFSASLATLDLLVGPTWNRLGGPLTSVRAPTELTIDANGTYRVSFETGCESTGEVWGYREESSPSKFFTRSESALWLTGGCPDSLGNPRLVSVDVVDGRVFLNGAAFDVEPDQNMNHALGPTTNGVTVHVTYAPPSNAGGRTVLDVRVVNDRTDSIHVLSVDVNTTSLVVNDERDGYSTSTRSPDMTTRVEQTIASGGRADINIEVDMPDGAGANVNAFVRFEANGSDKTAGVQTSPLYTTG